MQRGAGLSANACAKPGAARRRRRRRRWLLPCSRGSSRPRTEPSIAFIGFLKPTYQRFARHALERVAMRTVARAAKVASTRVHRWPISDGATGRYHSIALLWRKQRNASCHETGCNMVGRASAVILARIRRLRVAGIISACGCSSMAEQKLPKLTTRVRFPSPAPDAS
jgi:hypothetical protein